MADYLTLSEDGIKKVQDRLTGNAGAQSITREEVLAEFQIIRGAMKSEPLVSFDLAESGLNFYGIAMNRKKFIESFGATCSNWTWSWSFVNHKDRVVIFGAWDYHVQSNSYLILDTDWEIGDKGRKQPGYSQAVEHIALVQDEGYALMTFTMHHSDKHKDENGQGPAKIGDFDRRLTLRTLKRVKQQILPSNCQLLQIQNRMTR
jgi:predicted HNH restriction endonuclease